MARRALRREGILEVHVSPFNVSESSYHRFFAVGHSLEVKQLPRILGERKKVYTPLN